MNARAPSFKQWYPDAFRFYRHVLDIMDAAGVPFLLGGACGFAYYTGILRHTKDLDLFVRPVHVRQTLDVFAAAGYRAELVFSHWLAKAYHGDDFVDIIFNSGNGMCPVDEAWFDHAVAGELLGASVRFVPPEEMIWQKAYIMERERFDGADVNHLLRACGRRLDWDRLLARFGPHWRILLSHLVLFGFVYPEDRESVPGEVLHTLVERLQNEPTSAGASPLCQGTLLSRTQYLVDLEEWGYADPRLAPLGRLTQDQIARWTDAGR
jgi:hypothetical protein